jgi:hypothetical protein
MTRSNFLNYGGLPNAEAIQEQETFDYLVSMGFGNGELHQARKSLLEMTDFDESFHSVGDNLCDFCYDNIMGGEYEKLKDGRDRCMRCSRTKLATGEQFIYEFERLKTNMEVVFGITILPIREVQMVNAKTIAKNTNEEYTPTSGVDARVLGYATQSAKGTELFLENGAPRMAAISTLAHELTHIWQYGAWKRQDIARHYGKKYVGLIYEGMAMWAQVQYLIAIREFDFASRLIQMTINREDIYGLGFKVFVEQYPLQLDGDVGMDSPFHKKLPLE